METPAPRFFVVLRQRAPWPDLLAAAREIDALGFDGLFLVDHFYGLFNVEDPTHEAYTMLAALAPFTQNVQLGVLVCGNTYRNPAFLLKQAVTVDHVSGGRVIFGVGAGWVEREHEAYGWEFPSAKERVDRFAEALEIWDLLQREERTTYEGTHYQLIDAPFQPKPFGRPRLPLLIGGSKPRMLRLTARHADLWNTIGTPKEAATVSRQLDDVCRQVGRDPAAITRGVSTGDDLLTSVEAFAAGVNAYRDAGFGDLYFSWPPAERERDVLRRAAREVIPSIRGDHSAPSTTSPTAPLRQLSAADVSAVAQVYADVSDATARRLLDTLIDHPEERLDGAALMTRLNLQRHDEVARSFAALGAAFAARGLARPWNEAQRGYLLPQDRATILAQARSHQS
ncbi:MAG: LLM class flavin-dependent oxidoreductase [Chloroflexota bacterium]|nr:LLM class flavin-dependent oxidoreductase [Chloroflexota bacterium]